MSRLARAEGILGLKGVREGIERGPRCGCRVCFLFVDFFLHGLVIPACCLS